ncbi:MAG TPA: periplasmic heavy metal sensor [Terriglobales bacterium]|nr:periplasmic heavy metal sensor [Terriglobales bacterium]
MKAIYIGSILMLAGMANAQEMRTPGPSGERMGHEQRQHMERKTMREVHAGVRVPPGHGKWWKNSEVVQQVGINEEQVKKMEQIFQEYRLKLIDQHAALQREETLLEPLIESDQPNETAIVSQIDRVASARAELEKANALMFLGIRRVMTAEQWKKLRTLTPPPPPPPGAPNPPEPGMRKRSGVPPGEELD